MKYEEIPAYAGGAEQMEGGISKVVIKHACAGTVESSDIFIEVEPAPEGSGIALSVASVVYEQFGEEIEAVIRDTLEQLGETDLHVIASDRGAVDCTIRARVETAVCRGRGELE